MQNRADLLSQLTEIHRHLEYGEIAIEERKRIITALCASGKDATEAKQLLTALEEEREKFMAEFDRVLDILDKLPRPDRDPKS